VGAIKVNRSEKCINKSILPYFKCNQLDATPGILLYHARIRVAYKGETMLQQDSSVLWFTSLDKGCARKTCQEYECRLCFLT
jgi:hypothetical protein